MIKKGKWTVPGYRVSPRSLSTHFSQSIMGSRNGRVLTPVIGKVRRVLALVDGVDDALTLTIRLLERFGHKLSSKRFSMSVCFWKPGCNV